MEDVAMLKRFNEFEIYVEGKSDDPNAELTLNLIREFKQGLEQNEEELGKSKELGSISPGPIWPDPRKRRSMPWFRRLRRRGPRVDCR
jgi:hypothetical protein